MRKSGGLLIVLLNLVLLVNLLTNTFVLKKILGVSQRRLIDKSNF